MSNSKSLWVYLQNVFRMTSGLASGLVFIATEINLIIAFLFDETSQNFRFSSIVLLLGSFLLFAYANFRLYDDLLGQLDALSQVEANVVMSVKESGFSAGRAYTDQGLPVEIVLWLKIQFDNIGREKGAVEILEDEADLPVPFSNEYTLHVNPELWVPAKDFRKVDWEAFFHIAERDPEEFARQLHRLLERQYRVKIIYHTKRVGGASAPKTLLIEGKFDLFYQDILNYWESYNFPKLAQIAKTGYLL